MYDRVELMPFAMRIGIHSLQLSLASVVSFSSSSSSDSSEISTRSWILRLDFFLPPLPLVLMVSRKPLLSILACSLGADATSWMNSRS